MVTTRRSGRLHEVLATVGATCAAGVVLFAGVSLGRTAIADQAEATPGLATPQRLGQARNEVELGAGFALQGVPTRMSLFWTDDGAAQVADLYEAQWSAAGLSVERKVADRVTSVSAIDFETGVMRAVSIMDTGEDRLVVPNVSTVTTLPDFSPAAPVPLPEGLQAFSAHKSDEGDRANWVGSYVVASRPEEMAAFYRQELKARGFEPSSSGSATRDRVHNIEAERGPERMTVTISDTGGEDGQSSLVFVNHVRKYEVLP